MFDKNKRQINYLRISVTDNCNLRCQYCMPKNSDTFYNNCELLNSKQIEKIVQAFSLIGITKVRITGGEPLIRKDFNEILKKINNIESIKKIAITTNGINLLGNLDKYKKNGLNEINISLDSLKEDKYKEITRGGNFSKVFNTIIEASKKGFKKIKLNVVIMKGINDDEIIDFVSLTKDLNINVRFIELMPIGEGKNFKPVKNSEIIDIIKKNFSITECHRNTNDGPASYYKIPGFLGEIGFISPLSNNFCSSCNRVRVTSKGFLKLCLHFNKGIDLIPYLDDNTSVEKLSQIIEDAIYTSKPKEHNMVESLDSNIGEIETKCMNEIGG